MKTNGLMRMMTEKIRINTDQDGNSRTSTIGDGNLRIYTEEAHQFLLIFIANIPGAFHGGDGIDKRRARAFGPTSVRGAVVDYWGQAVVVWANLDNLHR